MVVIQPIIAWLMLDFYGVNPRVFFHARPGLAQDIGQAVPLTTAKGIGLYQNPVPFLFDLLTRPVA
jgi:hypothetical protein